LAGKKAAVVAAVVEEEEEIVEEEEVEEEVFAVVNNPDVVVVYYYVGDTDTVFSGERVDVPPNGHCLYSAIAVCLGYDDITGGLELLSMVVDFYRNNWDSGMPGDSSLLVRHAVGEWSDAEDYIERLSDVNSDDIIYGGQVEVRVLSVLLDVKITQLLVNKNKRAGTRLRPVTASLVHDGGGNTQQQQEIVIILHNYKNEVRNHYMALKNFTVTHRVEEVVE
jgi:hypothetical protein